MSYLFLQINSSYLCGNQDTFNIIHVFTITFDQLNASLMNMINRNCLKNIQYVYLYTYFNFDGFVCFVFVLPWFTFSLVVSVDPRAITLFILQA